MQIPTSEILAFHKQRNEIYHEGTRKTPPLATVKGIRKAAFWIFAELFNYRPEEIIFSSNLLKRNSILPLKETEELQQIKQLLNEILQMTGVNKESDEPYDLVQAVTLINNLKGVPENINSLLSSIFSSNLADSANPPAVKGMNTVSSFLEDYLHEFQVDIANKVLEKAISKVNDPTQSPFIGSIYQSIGTGITSTLSYFVKRFFQRPELSNFSLLIIADRLALMEQLSHFFHLHIKEFDIPIYFPNKTYELEYQIYSTGPKIIISTVQMVLSPYASIPNIIENLIIVGYQLSPNFMYKSLLRLSGSQGILFTSQYLSKKSNWFTIAPKIASYMRDDAKQKVLPVKIIKVPTGHQFELLSDLSQLDYKISKNNPFTSVDFVEKLTENVFGELFETSQSNSKKHLVIVHDRNTAFYLYKALIYRGISPDTIGLYISSSKFDSIELIKALRDKNSVIEDFYNPDSACRLIIITRLMKAHSFINLDLKIHLAKHLPEHLLLELISTVCWPKIGKTEDVIVDYIGQNWENIEDINEAIV